MKHVAILCCVVLLIGSLMTGCGGSRASGKNSNQDKPKPADVIE